jgi:putative sterol carrier protein
MTDASVDEAAKVRSVLKDLAVRGYEPALHRTTGSYELKIDQVGSWRLAIRAGSITVSEQTADPDSDTVLEMSARDFLDIVEGRSDLVAAFLRGSVKGSGDPALALGLRRLMPATI